MIIQVICLAAGAALACLCGGIAALRGAPGNADGWGSPLNVWQALIVFTVANMAALAAGVDPAGDWSLAAPLWVAATLFHGLFWVVGLAPAGLTAALVGLGMSGWIVAMAIQAA